MSAMPVCQHSNQGLCSIELCRYVTYFLSSCSVDARRHVRSHLRVSTLGKSPTPAKNHPCQHYYQPCNRICLTGTLLSQLQHWGLSPFLFVTLPYPKGDIWHASTARKSVFRIQISWIARAIPNNKEQSRLQTRAHA